MTSLFDNLTDSLRSGRRLACREAEAAFDEIMSGRLADEQIERFLLALADKGEVVDEIVGAAQAMRRHATPIPCGDPDAIDTCGAGGDGINTFNVSTAAAIVAAGAGAVVAKHGNRTNTRKSGSAEVLQALGVNIDAPPEVVAQCLRQAGIAFLYAARLHPAMRYAAEVRRRIGRRTIFNLLGPLTNPAGVRRQVVGVADEQLMEKMAAALQQLGAVHALVVHGCGGICDFSIAGPSSFIELRGGRLHTGSLAPEDVGLDRAPLEALAVADPRASAEAIRSILAGERGPRRDHTLLNAAAALVVGGRASSFRDGLVLAAEAIDDGSAARKLELLIALTGTAS